MEYGENPYEKVDYKTTENPCCEIFLDEDKKVNKMKNDKIENMLAANTDSAKTASAVAAGSTINKVVMEKIKPQLPLLLKGYADTPIAEVVMANIAVFAAQNFAADNAKAKWITEAMLTAAMTKFATSFNLEGLINEVLASAQVTVPDITYE